MQRKQFDQLALEIARAEHPEYKWRLAGDWLEADASADAPGTDEVQVSGASLSLASLHAKAPHSGDVRGWLRERLSANFQTLEQAQFGDWATEAANIRPVIKHSNFLLAAERGRAENDRGMPACVFPWYGPLCVSCVIDRPTILVHITQEHLDTWQVSAEEVFTRAQANLHHEPPLMIAVHRLAGFTVAHVEPSPYTAAYAILPGFRQALAQMLGPRFRICLAVENLLAAYTPNGAAYNRAHEEELAQDLIEATRADGDPSKPLPFTGHIAVDIEAGTVAWRPHQSTTEQDQEADRIAQSLARFHTRGSSAPHTRKNYTQ